MLRRPIEFALTAGVAVMDQTCCGETGVRPSPGEQGLLQGGEDQGRGFGGGDSPAQDPAGVDIGHEGHVNEPGQRPDVGEIRDPPLIWGRGRIPLPVDEVRVAGRFLVPPGGDRVVPSAADPFDSGDPHQPGDLVTAHLVAGPA